jgi:hypothetical protein
VSPTVTSDPYFQIVPADWRWFPVFACHGDTTRTSTAVSPVLHLSRDALAAGYVFVISRPPFQILFSACPFFPFSPILQSSGTYFRLRNYALLSLIIDVHLCVLRQHPTTPTAQLSHTAILAPEPPSLSNYLHLRRSGVALKFVELQQRILQHTSNRFSGIQGQLGLPLFPVLCRRRFTVVETNNSAVLD